MTEKNGLPVKKPAAKKLTAKKPTPKKKPTPMTDEQYHQSMEREVINILKLRGLYSYIEDFAGEYSQGTRRIYKQFDYFMDFLEDRTEEHLAQLEKIVGKKDSHLLGK
ncbi:Uncharacterised protein [uncultured archaeon]|nr:Uncharacterised protein [uncultured archaeon]